MDLPDPRPLALEVRAREQLTPLVIRVVLGGDDLLGFEFAPGQDLMLAVPTDANTVDGGTINRRYTIRRADPAAGTVDLDLVVHGDAPGARWASDAQLGSSIAAVGPRGKVLPAAAVDWHLFVCDESGWAASAAMVESLTASERAVVVADVADEEEQQPLDAVADVYVSWCNRDGTPPGRSEQVLAALEHLTLPDGRGHAYLSAEFAVVRAVSDWLTAHGFASDDIAPKAYWRAGRPNAPHGEPLRDA
jgi:NADPH-dependent ferric siderophore reductase